MQKQIISKAKAIKITQRYKSDRQGITETMPKTKGSLQSLIDGIFEGVLWEYAKLIKEFLGEEGRGGAKRGNTEEAI